MPFAIRRRRMAKGRTDRLGLTGPDNDGSTPLFLASGAPPVCIHSTMAPSSPKSNKASLNPFLLSKGACEAEKHEKNSAKKVHQMMPRASNDALGRIDTRTTTWAGVDVWPLQGSAPLPPPPPTNNRHPRPCTLHERTRPRTSGGETVTRSVAAAATPRKRGSRHRQRILWQPP